MKTYQFVGFILIGLLIAAALLAGRRRGCGCHKMNQGAPVEVPVETEGA